jgi:hypothetical protein
MKVIYVRERSASVYSTFAYWFAGALINLPLVIICHVIFLNIAYWMVGLSDKAEPYVYTLFVTLLNNLVAFYFAQFLAASAASAQVRNGWKDAAPSHMTWPTLEYAAPRLCVCSYLC